MASNYCIQLYGVPRSLQRGMRMCAAKNGITLRDYIISTLYSAVNKELAEVAGASWWREINPETGTLENQRRRWEVVRKKAEK